MDLEEFLKTLPKREQKRFWRGSRLLDYIIEKRCQHPEMLAKPATPKARGVAGK